MTTATQMSDGDLVSAVTRVAAEGRHRTADLIALLAALETRTVHLEAGYASVFRFCVGRLRLSEEEAFYRIAASRVAARFPVVLERLREGRVTLTAVALLRKHLTEANHLSVLDAAEGRSKREVQALVATLAPQPDVPVSIRRLPPPRTLDLPSMPPLEPPQGYGPVSNETPRPVAALSPLLPPVDEPATPAPAARSVFPVLRIDVGASTPPSASLRVRTAPPLAAAMAPLAPGRYSLRLTISEETHAKLRRAEDLLAHTVPAGDTAAVLDRALTLLLAHLERQKYGALRPRAKKVRASQPPPVSRVVPAAASPPGASEEPRAPALVPEPPEAGASPAASARKEKGRPARRTRCIPAAVRRDVWKREGGRCGYVAPDGTRCEQTSMLEFHHTIPVADGGSATTATVGLRCRPHHAMETRRWFGEEVSAYRNNPGGGVMTGGRHRHPGWP